MRLQSTFVSTDRPDVYPLSDSRGTELKSFRNVGSGVVSWVRDMKDYFDSYLLAFFIYKVKRDKITVDETDTELSHQVDMR